MQRSGILFSGLCLIVLIGAVACTNPATGKPEAVVDDAVADTTGSAEGVVFGIGAESSIGFVGSKVTGSHEGGFHSFHGEITLVDNNVEASRVEVVIDTTTLWADNERLTGHLKSPDFFEVETFPTATFSSTAITADETGYTITGNLDLHGVTKSISFPATIELGEGQITADAEFSVKRFDFGIMYPGKADDLIRDEVLIKLHLVGVTNEAG